jgi:hypothetical protein
MKRDQYLNGHLAGTGGGEMSSFNSSMRADHEEFNESIDDFKKNKKRVQNRESALRSRMKKKTYYENIEV